MLADRHPSPDDLVLLALGESAAPEVMTHVESCPQCSAEVQSWASTADTARQAEVAGWLPDAPGRIWRGVVAELGLTDVEDPASVRAAAPDTAAGTQVVHHPARADTARVEPIRRTNGSGARRPRRWMLVAAAAVLGAVVGGGAVYAFSRPSTGVVERRAVLVGLPGGQPEVAPDQRVGDAELVATTGGQALTVKVQALPAIPGAYEVWLIGNDKRMVSLGALAGDTGTFTVPAGIDTAEYATVDISNEPADGNPAHSSNSIARGQLG